MSEQRLAVKDTCGCEIREDCKLHWNALANYSIAHGKACPNCLGGPLHEDGHCPECRESNEFLISENDRLEAALQAANERCRALEQLLGDCAKLESGMNDAQERLNIATNARVRRLEGLVKESVENCCYNNGPCSDKELCTYCEAARAALRQEGGLG